MQQSTAMLTQTLKALLYIFAYQQKTELF